MINKRGVTKLDFSNPKSKIRKWDVSVWYSLQFKVGGWFGASVCGGLRAWVRVRAAFGDG